MPNSVTYYSIFFQIESIFFLNLDFFFNVVLTKSNILSQSRILFRHLAEMRRDTMIMSIVVYMMEKKLYLSLISCMMIVVT